MDEVICNVKGVEYKFDRQLNKDIACFDWFIERFKTESWESETFEIFDNVKNLNKNAIDTGAWIGATSIWLSKNFKNVLSIDGDLVAHQALVENLKSSKCENVITLNRPVYSSESDIVFGVNQFNENFQKEGLGSSTSQIKNKSLFSSDKEVKGITIDKINEMFPLKDVSFIKVDIEGGEENILNSLFENAKKYDIELLISFHYEWWNDKNINRFADTFEGLGDVRFDKWDNLIQDHSKIIPHIINNPFTSIYFKFQ
jgi:FkbM family methyltransferase